MGSRLAEFCLHRRHPGFILPGVHGNVVVCRAAFTSNVQNPLLFQGKQGVFKPGSTLPFGRNSQVNGHARGMHREGDGIGGLGVDGAQQAGNNKLLAASSVVLLTEPIKE